MKIRNYIYALALTFGLVACSVEGPDSNMPSDGKLPEVSDEVVAGELLIRFTPQVGEILDNAGLLRSADVPQTRSGILSVDEILDIAGGYEFERVFPVDVRNEQRSRKAGMHLWYVVRFDENESVYDVAKKLSALGEVSMVGYNYRLKRAENAKVTPLSLEEIKALAPAANKAEGFNDELFSNQWNLQNNGTLRPTKFITGSDVNVVPAWKMSTGDPSIVVAVLDEGVDINHEDLQGSLWVNEGEVLYGKTDVDGNGYAGDVHGYNFVGDNGMISTDSKYDSGHGTHVAGVIAARNNNNIGLSSIAGGDGSADSGVRIMSCQIFSGDKAGTLLDEVRAIKYAADNGAVVLQCSWGYISGAANPFEWQPQFKNDKEWMTNVLEVDALDYFVHNAGSADGVVEGGIVVFAAGNEDAPAASYPGAYSKFVSVAAVAGDFTPATYTNYGIGTTISAPGGDQDYYYDYGEGLDRGHVGCILSTVPKTLSPSGYAYMEGTSMACPHVSGVVALGLSYAAQLRKHFKAEQVIDMLYKSCNPIDKYMTGSKTTYKFTVDLGLNHPKKRELEPYQGRMGHGLVDAASFLAQIGDSRVAVDMSFPNVLVAEGADASYLPSMYFKDGEKLNYEVSIENEAVATCKLDGKKLVFHGVAFGQTKATIKTSAGLTQDFVITVSGASNGWL